MKMLVVFGSKRGGTRGLAEMIAADAFALGAEVDALDARVAPKPDGYDAVVVCGALYMGRWHRAARHYVRRHQHELTQTAVWLVSSGPLDASAEERDIRPVAGVRKLMKQVGAKGHATFGGRLEADATGFPASAMAKKSAGDWRDADHVRAWTAAVVAAASGASGERPRTHSDASVGP